MVLRVSALLIACVPLTGCVRGCTMSHPPIHPNPSMDDQPKVRPQAASTFFYNGQGMREPVPGTVAVGELREDPVFYTGKNAAGQFVAAIPVAVDEALLQRGEQRYAIYCQPCHDARGDGKGILFQRANVPTATFHQEKILKYADGQLFDIISNGSGLMPAYKWPIPPADRWAIIAHVRDLERKRLASAPTNASAPAPAPVAPESGAKPGAKANAK
jgi:mono/diheme cytochrome c family protein